MKLIVALGNPSEKYSKTRHNAGFMALDFYLREQIPAFNAKFNADMLKIGDVIFAKPQTFMNASGEAVKRIADFYKISEMLVLHDDLDLPLGAVRFKFGGGNAGHNGLKSIDNLFSNQYTRIRIGIGKPSDNKTSDKNANKNAVANFVLEDFSQSEREALQDSFEIIANAIDVFIQGENLAVLQSRYSKRQSQ